MATTKFDFRSIKSFEDACKALNIEPVVPITPNDQDEFIAPSIKAYRLMVIFKAINNGWRPNWADSNQEKYFPWYKVLSSGSGFSRSDYVNRYTSTSVCSRLCTDTAEKALYIAEQFEAEYEDYFLYKD